MDENVSSLKEELVSLRKRMVEGNALRHVANEIQGENGSIIDAQELQFITDRSPAMSFLFEWDGVWSTLFASLNVRQLGYTPNDFLSQRVELAAVVHSEDEKKLFDAVHVFSREKPDEPLNRQFRIVSGSGEIHWISSWWWVASAEEPNRGVEDPDASDEEQDAVRVLYQCVMVDITDTQEKIEQLKLKAEILDKIIAERTVALRDATKRLREEIAEHRNTGEQLRERTVELTVLNKRYSEESSAARRKELELKRENLLLASALEGSDVGSWEWNMEKDRIHLDQKAQLMMEKEGGNDPYFTLEQMRSAVTSEYLPEVDAAMEEHFEGRRSFVDVEFPVLSAETEKRWVELRGKVVEWKNDHEPLRMAGIIIDSTDKKKTVNELRKTSEINETANKAKKEFIDILACEARIPIHSIQGFSEFGLNRYDTASREKLKEYFTSINDDSKRLLIFLDELLNFAKVESGSLVFTFQDVDMVELVEEISEGYTKGNGKNTIILSLSDDFKQDASVVLDRKKITQVIGNILHILHESHPDEGTVELTLEKRENAMRVVIHHHDVNIPEKDLEQIFETYYLFESTTSLRIQGFGLEICKEIVEGHNGRIWAENNVEGGVQFVFEVPLSFTSAETLEKVSALAGRIHS